MRSNRGATLTEVLLAVAVVAGISYAVMSASSTLFQVESQTNRITDSGKMVVDIIENIRSDPSLFQINFTPAAVDDSTLLATGGLPMAYRPGFFGKVSDCPSGCTTHIGYVIRPYQGYRGLFRLVIRTYDTKTTEDKMFYALVLAN